MTYLGDFAEDATVRRFFNTVDTNGAPVTIGGTAAAQVYKDGGTTQITAGITITEDFDGVTGLHLLAVDMSADAGYTTGSDYAAVISVGTADSVSIVGGVLSQWSCENRRVNLIKDGAIGTDTFASGVLSTDEDLATAVGTELAGDFTAIPAAVWAVDASSSITIGSVKQTLVTTIPGDIAALNDLDSSAVTAACASALTTYDPPTRTEATADKAEILTRLGTPAGASVSADVAAVKAETANIVADTNELQTDWANGGRLDLLLDQAATASGAPTASQIADAVWDEATSGHTTAGTFGEQLKMDVDAILADTNELQTDWANGGRLDAILDTAASGGSAPTASQIADAVWTETLADHSATAGSTAEALNNSGSAGTVSTVQVSNDRTWFAEEYRSRNIVTVGNGFAGTLCVVPDLNPETTIASITSVAITGAASVTASSSAVRADKQAAHFTVPALTTSGTYTVLLKVLTNDSQTIPTTCVLKVV